MKTGEDLCGHNPCKIETTSLDPQSENAFGGPGKTGEDR
jgi:hypothetical protein